MLTIIAIAGSLFGHGHWACEYSYEYPQDNLKESFYNEVVHRNDLTYSSQGYIEYTLIGSGTVVGRIGTTETGKVEVVGQEFSIFPINVSTSLEFDEADFINPEFMMIVEEQLSQSGHGLKVVSVNDTQMEIIHQESGTVTSCTSLKQSDM